MNEQIKPQIFDENEATPAKGCIRGIITRSIICNIVEQNGFITRVLCEQKIDPTRSVESQSSENEVLESIVRQNESIIKWVSTMAYIYQPREKKNADG